MRLPQSAESVMRRLSLRCPHCSWLMRVDPAFAGARCRCKHCGAVIDVPAGAPVAVLPRPMQPTRRRPNVQVPGGAGGRWRSRVRSSPAWRGLVLAGMSILVVAIAWPWLSERIGSANARVVVDQPIFFVDRNAVARVPSPAALGRLPSRFLDQPLDASRVAWLIDGGTAMAKYYADVTTLVATAMSQLSPGRQEFSLLLTSEKDTRQLTSRSAGDVSVQAACRAMRDFELGGRPNMAGAFRDISAAAPEVVFLVVCQPTDNAAVDEIIRTAAEREITVCVVTIGEPNHGWARAAYLTHGEYKCLREQELRLRTALVIEPPLSAFESDRLRPSPRAEREISGTATRE